MILRRRQLQILELDIEQRQFRLFYYKNPILMITRDQNLLPGTFALMIEKQQIGLFFWKLFVPKCQKISGGGRFFSFVCSGLAIRKKKSLHFSTFDTKIWSRKEK